MNATTEPDQQLRVLLVRHAQTALNAEGRIRGRADPELNEVGLQQAHATAVALRAYRLGRVVTSPLQRAVRTGQIIATESGVPQSVDPAYLDRDYGACTGRLRSEVLQQWGSIDAAPGVEPTAAVLDRARHGLDALTDTGTVAVVTHDAVIRPLLTSIRPGITPEVETCSWAVLLRVGAGWQVESFDNTAPTD
ncbi:histidine phosphatase family protein [Granulicoccus phenolivorans]|uniref:histidine phosphatase family protein n=1 Tax=Granulicoccus phenolivorans TaxID=266854 RepID=UPI000415B554|nr:histidine phosphatase family protein [Granulicoccus phenolivorans]